MKSIKIDDQVYEYLQRHARPFEDTPNGVLRRLLRVDDGSSELVDAGSVDRTEPKHSGQEADASSVTQMRRAAIESIEASLSKRTGQDVVLRQQHADGAQGKRGPREQRFVTPGGQVIYIRTRSFDEAKLPFFTMQPSTLEDADWYVFVCDRRGHVVMAGDELRRLAPGLHRDSGGDYKPTFIVDDDRCEVYAHGEPLAIPEARNAYDAIAAREPRAG